MKKFKRFIMTLLCLSFVFSSMFIYASADQQMTGYALSPAEVINAYSNADFEYTIDGQLEMSSLSGSSNYTLFKLLPYGYAVLFNNSILVEACYSENSVVPIDILSTNTIYYGGPGIYCTKIDDLYYNNLLGSYYSDNEIVQLSNQEAYIQNALSLNSTVKTSNLVRTGRSSGEYTTTSVAYNYFSNMLAYGTNENGTCTVIASQILINYYDDYVNDNFIVGDYDIDGGSTEDFHQLLNSFVYGSGQQKGIKIRNAKEGINRYLHSRGVDLIMQSTYGSTSIVVNQIISTLQSGKPVIASLLSPEFHSDGRDLNHTVLVFSATYDPDSPTATAVLTVNMGWNSRQTYVFNAILFYECGYLTSGQPVHTMGT